MRKKRKKTETQKADRKKRERGYKKSRVEVEGQICDREKQDRGRGLGKKKEPLQIVGRIKVGA